MEQFETAHYIFHYGADTQAARDIEAIAAYQESCYAYICNVLGVTLDFKIHYYLCASPEEVGRLYNDGDEPCDGFAETPDKIYAVYNAETQCIGFHEDAHIISYTVNSPESTAIREGLAMYFDRKWWGIHNMDWTGYYIKMGQYISVAKLLEEEIFDAHDCWLTYPIMGAFTEWLISAYGMERYMRLYKQKNTAEGMQLVYQKTPEELDKEFTSFIELFAVDEKVKQRMEELLNF
ncbi:MAG: hypothetical protein IKW00_04365 [Clostridia bacterium]|nr:hypothetical protein [Clostridia bacterium]